MVIRVLCFLIQGNMDAALVTFGQPIRLTKVPINQKPQNCRFVLTDESGQKMRGKNTRGLILPHNSLCGNRQDNLFKKCVVFSINVSRCFARSVASEKMIGTWRFLISDTPPIAQCKYACNGTLFPPISCFDKNSLFDWVSWVDFWGMREGFRD